MYKFIDENRIEKAQNPLFVDGIAYSNASEEKLRELGYKNLVVEEEMPTQEGYFAVPFYVDGEYITQKWRLVADVEFER